MTFYIPEAQIINGTGSGALAATLTINTPVIIVPTPPAWYQQDVVTPSDKFPTHGLSTSSSGAVQLVGHGNNSLYVSTDTGANFTEASPMGGDNGSWDDLDVSGDGSSLWVSWANNGRLWNSIDDGANWTEYRPGAVDSDFSWCQAVSNDGSYVLAGQSGGNVYVSSNSGTGWTDVTAAVGVGISSWSDCVASSTGQYMAITTFTQTPSEGYVYTSSNYGSTWTSRDPFGSSQRWASLDMSSDGSVLIARKFDNPRSYLSSDYGVNWAEIQPRGNVNAEIAYSLSSDGGIIYAACRDERVYKSTDTGANWSEVDVVGANNCGWKAVAIDADASVIIAGSIVNGDSANGHIQLSTDSGANFTDTAVGENYNADYLKTRISGDGSTMLASYDQSGVLGLGISTDDGDTWTDVLPPLATEAIYGLACSYTGDVIYAASWDVAIYKSVDYGVNWTDVEPVGTGSAWGASISCSSDGSVVLAGDEGGRLWLSVDSGANWTEPRPAGDVDTDWAGVCVSGDGQTMVVGGWSIPQYVSTNGGTSWTQTYINTDVGGGGDTDFQTIDSNSDGTMIIAGNYGHPYTTTNKGVSWTEHITSAEAYDGTSVDRTGQYLCAVGDDGAAGPIQVSTNYGSTWTDFNFTPPGGVGDNWFRSSIDDQGRILLGCASGALWLYK